MMVMHGHDAQYTMYFIYELGSLFPLTSFLVPILRLHSSILLFVLIAFVKVGAVVLQSWVTLWALKVVGKLFNCGSVVQLWSVNLFSPVVMG